MVIAALVSFVILLVAWVAAPDAARRAERSTPETGATEAHALAA